MLAYFTRRAPDAPKKSQPDPEVLHLATQSRQVIARNNELLAEFAGVERALKERKWTTKP